MGSSQDLEQLQQLRRQVERQLNRPAAFGAELHRLRKQRGLTLDELAELSGISKAYLSQIENNRTGPPRDAKVRRLETAFGLEPGTLVELAHLGRTPEDVRGRLSTLQDAFTRAEEALGRALAQARRGAGGDVDGRQSVRGQIPIINRVSAGYPAEFTDLGYPAGVADEYLGRPPGLSDTAAFAVRVVGDSMSPRYRENDIVLFSPAAPVQSGDDCYVRFAPECRTAEGATFKRVYFDTPETVRLQPRNDRYPPTVVPLAEVTGIYKAVFRYEAL